MVLMTAVGKNILLKRSCPSDHQSNAYHRSTREVCSFLGEAPFRFDCSSSHIRVMRFPVLSFDKDMSACSP